MEMPSSHDQEFQSSKFSESRNKADAQHMENSAEILWQKKNNSLEYESKVDHRRSLAWDSAFFTSPGILDPEELFEGLNFRDVASESLEQERTKRNCEINMRRSLAWDSAFFTSAGVLDPEELCLVNKGFKKCETHLIPEIEENIWSSAESNSLINSGSSSLASLEIDLFDDAKLSVYETSNTTNVTPSSCILRRENGLQNTRCMKKLDASSTVKTKSMLALKRQSLYKNVSERRAKVASLPPQAQQVARGGYCSPLSALEPPKASVQVNYPLSTPSKRASSGSNNIKMENKAKKTAPGQHMIASKRPCLRKLSPKSPSLSSHTPMNKSAGLGAAISDYASRSSQKPLRRKIDCRLVSSCSPSPFRNLHGNKIELLNSSRPSHLLSPLESSRTSPSSSIDIWSSESSASINQRSISSTESLDNTCKENSSDHDFSHASDSERHICDRNCFTQGDQDNRFVNQRAKTISMRNSSVLASISINIKPSSLRMPSPKIGYFDAQHSVALTPNGDMRFHSGVHSSSSKTGRGVANHSGVATRTIRGKLQPRGTLSEIDSQKTGELRHPLGNRLCGSASSEKDKVNKGFMNLKKGMKREGLDSQRTTKHEDANKQSPLHILTDDDKENLCSFHNQAENLSKRIEAINFNQDLEI